METPEPPYGLVVFDLDGTLLDLQEPIWKILHARFGSDPLRRRRAVARARAGEITYGEWFSEDLAMLRERGVTRQELTDFGSTLPVTPGAVELIDDLRSNGVRVAILSGGLDVIRDAALPDLTVDAEHINKIVFAANGTIRGGTPTAYDGVQKADGLRSLSLRFSVDLERVAFVGDGPNDITAAEAAGFSVAWGHAHPGLLSVATEALTGPSMDLLRPLLLPG